MSDFVVYPQKAPLVQDVARELRARFSSVSSEAQAQALAQGAVELLWGRCDHLNVQEVVQTLSQPQKLSAALHAFEEQASAIAIWADAFRGSPDGAVLEDRLPR